MAVEINALWINALGVLGDREALRSRAVASFETVFGGPHLRDTADDPALRPNQLLAYSLPYGPLAGQRPPSTVDALVTPLGLRSLDPADSRYTGRHAGGPADRVRGARGRGRCGGCVRCGRA